MTHPVIQAAELEVRRIMAAAHHGWHNARQIVRVEITHRVDLELRRESADDYELMASFFTQADGPISIRGISYYIVRDLPDPGWRVINPLKDVL